MTQQNYIDTHKERFLEELKNLLRIPSISADSAYKADCDKAAEFVKNSLTEAGADNAEVCPTAGNSVVYAEKLIDPKLPTVLVYGHYDVQPADPLDLWQTPPFEPTIRDGKIYARGACDDKGQFYMHIKAFEAMVKTNTLPCNVKFMIEGEEEIGSDNLDKFVIANKAKLKADVILISDTSMIANDCPSITVGLRGLSYLEVEVTGPNRDLHSGTFGGAVYNPIQALCEMLASLKDENMHITIPGLYDDVQELSKEERAEMARAPYSEEAYKKHLDIDAVAGEKGYTTNERTSIRPTFEINGIWGGYIGEGAKTVLPSKAHAKVSMRLVPNQSSAKISALFQQYFESIAPAGIRVKVKPHHGGEAVVTPTDTIEYTAAKLAYEETFGVTPIPMRDGGSVPCVAMFEKELGIKTLLMGFGLHSDAIHSPNEHYGLFNFYKGIETIPQFYKHYAKLKQQ